MKLFVGLGNPGHEYENTRHNAGFLFADKMAQEFASAFEHNKYVFSDVAKSFTHIIAKPDTFMNSSGKAVKALVVSFDVKLEDLYVAHDDLDLPLGEYKIQFGVGPKVHNGINSVEETLESQEFWRIRIGVDNRDPLNRLPGEAYVLQKFTKEELKTLDEVISRVIQDIKIARLS